MDQKQRILESLKKRGTLGGGELRELLGISRQAMSAHLRRLLDDGRVVRTGRTRGSRYRLASSDDVADQANQLVQLAGLDESRLYTDWKARFNLESRLAENVEAIVRYAFTEMVNNAIDHSEAESCRVHFEVSTATVKFQVRDRGIGIFHSIASKKHLQDENAALIELLKGRTTTMPEAHTGEGVFFTSRLADRFVIRSHRLEVEWSRRLDDVFVRQKRGVAGTDVRFELSRSTSRRIERIFSEFAPEEFDFELRRTRVLVKLLRTSYVSRSEGKRLCANLDQFKEVILDFRQVDGIGRGFADEVYRVFARSHPETQLKTSNANPAVLAMIRHVGTEEERSKEAGSGP